MTIILIGKAKDISLQLSRLQKTGLVPAGKPIKWDSRDDRHEDWLEVK